MRRPVFLSAAVLIAALAVPAYAGQATPAQEPAQEPAAASGALQGDQASWIADPHVHAFYDLTRETFAHGAGQVDEAAYTAKAYAIFRDFAASRGVPPEQMVEHLKLIPGQMVGIVREDPGVLKSYATFTDALFGPQ